MHNSNSLSMNGTKISILKQTNKISFSSFLKSGNITALESEICFEILCDFTNKSLEWKLPYQKLSALLVLADLTKCDGSGTESVELLDSSGCRSRFSGSFGGKLLPWCFSSGGFASCLLGTSHGDLRIEIEIREREKLWFICFDLNLS